MQLEMLETLILFAKFAKRSFLVSRFMNMFLFMKKNLLSNQNQLQPNISEFSMKNTEREKYEFDFLKFMTGDNFSFSLIEPFVDLLKTLKSEDLIRQTDSKKKINCNFSLIC